MCIVTRRSLNGKRDTAPPWKQSSSVSTTEDIPGEEKTMYIGAKVEGPDGEYELTDLEIQQLKVGSYKFL